MEEVSGEGDRELARKQTITVRHRQSLPVPSPATSPTGDGFRVDPDRAGNRLWLPGHSLRSKTPWCATGG